MDAHHLSLSSSSLPCRNHQPFRLAIFRFARSFRDVEEMLAQRGVVLTYETIRAWCLKFGQTYANDLRRRSTRPGDKWYLDEVFLKINGSECLSGSDEVEIQYLARSYSDRAINS